MSGNIMVGVPYSLVGFCAHEERRNGEMDFVNWIVGLMLYAVHALQKLRLPVG